MKKMYAPLAAIGCRVIKGRWQFPFFAVKKMREMSQKTKKNMPGRDPCLVLPQKKGIIVDY
jgi:hypothetical protein